MVNIPPLPPLLCSTPPPIDFGEDDDVDVLATDGVENDFGSFLSEDNRKNIDPLFTPTSPSVCDLPPVSIYDDLIPPDEFELEQKNHLVDQLTQPDSKNVTKSINLTEAFNFNVRNDTVNVEQANEGENLSKSLDVLEVALDKPGPNIQSACAKDENVKDLKIANDSFKAETVCKSSKTDQACAQNVVSIEDIVDDLSDNELYSPKTPKNFTEADNLNDYFKIEEIKALSTDEIEKNSKSLNSNSESLDISDNNESASSRNEHVNNPNSFSSNIFKQVALDIPSHSQSDANSIDEDDDFGDFADFQETDFTVPVNKNDINQQNGVEWNDCNKCNVSEYKNEPESIEEETNSSHNFATMKHDATSKQNILNLQEIPQEMSIHKNEVLTSLNEVDKFATFHEFPSPTPDGGKTSIKVSEVVKEPTNISKETSIDVYESDDDFADFEYHQNDTKLDRKKSSDDVSENVDDEDDDFGDFNTAEPVTPTAVSATCNTSSQNTATENSALPPKNLNTRISNILQIMFTTDKSSPNQDFGEPKTSKILDIPFTSIDTAKALEYQWASSNTRHSFIRSLGIDSRNILFGEKYNPSLPRFAANLSFNPLKPIKPAQPSGNAENPNTILESIPINTALASHSSEVPCSTKVEALDLNWNSSGAVERTIEALKDNNINPTVDLEAAPSMSYISNEPPRTEAVSLKILENTPNSEDKFSKTPPISEMESITTFTCPSPVGTKDLEMSLEMGQKVDDSDMKEVDEHFKHKIELNEVVVTSTFTGTFKETHIFTPSRTNDFEMKPAIATNSTSSSPSKASPIDFDYEKAAMGVIIDETVVKKEYRDVEYTPPFTIESLSKPASSKADLFENNSCNNMLCSTDIKNSVNNFTEDDEEDESNDDFCEFQSVSSEVTVSPAENSPKTSNKSEDHKSVTVSHGGMILSPAILIPQAIFLENQKPKIEWGDCTATINPEELARIEELFPEPKSLRSVNSSQKSTPTHHVLSTPSISATVANKELEVSSTNISNDDEDDWSEFVSVTATNTSCANRTVSNNNVVGKSPVDLPFKQRSPVVTHRMPPTIHNNSNYDDEWSEFVSSAPPSQQPNAYRVPQFNSGAWQNANFYNNPLSMYHKGPVNIPTAAATAQSAQNSLYNNNNNYNMGQQPYQIANNSSAVTLNINQAKPTNVYQQQIHVMQNFSTAPVPTPERLSTAVAAAKNNQFQSIGSAKIAPSIALIPDLGFVAPAIPTHTSFINSLPKPGINMKK